MGDSSDFHPERDESVYNGETDPQAHNEAVAAAGSTTQTAPDPAWPVTSPSPPPFERRPLAAPPEPMRPTRNAILFALTLMTTTYWGFLQYQQFYMEDVASLVLNPFAAPRLLLAGLPYGLAVITFLLAHEMGHYLACRYYGIRATLPFFIPFPPLIPLPGGFVPVLVPGTMGAVIRILTPLRSRRALFDVAIAGPIAGFIVALPLLAVGLSQSRVVDVQDLGPSISMGEPLIWGPLQAIFAPPVGPDQTLLAHPLAFVGWFALLVTAMNLLPVGQLDGGHLLYTIFPRAHRAISLVVVLGMAYAGLVYFTGWLFFALLVLFVLGTRHPRPIVFEQTLGFRRVLLLLAALAIFVTCFMLVPVTIDLEL